MTWKPIPGYEHLYQVSDTGLVKSMGGRRGGYKNERELRPKVMTDGYIYYRLHHTDKKQRYMPAHRAVALAFIPNPENKTQVNHKDFNKQNNHISNLEWVTPKENIAHSMAHGVHKPPRMNVKVSEAFEGPNSSLRKTFDAAVADDFDLPEPPPGPKAAKPKVHIGGANVCVSCEW